MKVILIDSSKLALSHLRRRLATTLPNIEVTEYDAEQQGLPAADFRWDLYDMAVIHHELADGPSGLDWLRHYARRPGFPPAVLVASRGDEYLAAEAIKCGAHDYLRATDVDDGRLGSVLLALPMRVAPPGRLSIGGSDALVLDTLGEPAWDGSHEPSRGHRFVRLIGQGGCSRVYLAEREDDGETVVLKVIDTQQIDAEAKVQRFIREAEIVAAIDDPHVVRVFDQGFTTTYGYIAMEFFPGGDLKQRLERGVDVAAALRYIRAVARGLDAIHRHHIVHRDLKPGNIMFRADDTLALADFGISRRLHEPSELTMSSGVLGTPSYISPEQAQGLAVDARADLYSAGIIFYELLVGRKPFRADSAAALVYQHLHAPVPRLPPPLAAMQPLIDLLLAKDPRDRFASAREFLDALDQWLPAAAKGRIPGRVQAA